VNENEGCFSIEHHIPMPAVHDNRFHRTAAKMIIGDSVLFPSRKESTKLQMALRRIKKRGSIRRERDGKGFRCFCVEPLPGKRGGRSPNSEKY